MKKLTLLLALVFVTIISTQAQTESTLKRIVENNELRVGMSGNQPPYTMTSKSGELIGYEVDLATLLAEAMGVKLKLIKLPFNDLLTTLEKGDVDVVMSGMTMTPERNMKALFVGPYMVSGKSILTKTDTLLALEKQLQDDPAGVSLVALKGSTSEDFVKAVMPDANLTLANDYDEAVELVLNDKVVVMVADIEICAVTILRNPEKNLATLEYPMTIEPIGMAINANDFLLENVISNYFESLEMVGALAGLELIWFENGAWLFDIE